MAKDIFFDHIPKTGGTSFHHILTTWFGRAHVSPQIAGERYSDVMVKYRDFSAISGHIHYGHGDRLPNGRLAITILRDPIDRAISQYFFNKENGSNLDLQRRVLFDLPIEEFFNRNDNTVFSEYSNIYTHHFAALDGRYHERDRPIDQNTELQLAQESLTKFNLVGFLENFEDFCAIATVMCEVFNFASPPKLRVTQNRIRVEDLSASTLRRLQMLNAADIELASFARTLFEKARTRTLIQLVSTASEKLPVVADSTDTSEVPAPVTLPATSRDFGTREIEILHVHALGTLSREPNLLTGEELSISVTLLAHQPADDLTIGLHISDPSGERVYGTNSRLLGMIVIITSPGQLLVHFHMKCELGRGEYRVGIAVHKGQTHLEKTYHWKEYCTSFNVVGTLGSYFEGKARLYPGISLQSNGDSPASFEATELGIDYPRSIMLQSPPLSEFKMHTRTDATGYQPKAGEIFNIPCIVSNLGNETWPIGGTRPVCLSYHWLNSDRGMVLFDGLRTRLPFEMNAGQTELVQIQVQAPYQQGDYALQITAVQETVGWFDERGCPPTEILVTVLN